MCSLSGKSFTILIILIWKKRVFFTWSKDFSFESHIERELVKRFMKLALAFDNFDLASYDGCQFGPIAVPNFSF